MSQLSQSKSSQKPQRTSKYIVLAFWRADTRLMPVCNSGPKAVEFFLANTDIRTEKSFIGIDSTMILLCVHPAIFFLHSCMC